MPFRIPNEKKQLGITIMLLGMLVGGGNLPPLFEFLVFYLILFTVALLAYVRNRFFNILLGCSIVFYIPAWFSAFHDASSTVLFCASYLVCLFYGIHSTIHFVLKSKHVTVGEILALVNCYLLMGFFWALLYTLLEGFFPGSFVIQVQQDHAIDSFVYFSFTTMTTVGYGDTLPHSVLAQRLSITQAIFGQFYFALVVAYLLNKLFQQSMSAMKKFGEE